MPPARARSREADAPILTVVADRPTAEPVSWCHYVADHQSDHRDVLTDSPWCVICTPKEVAK